MTVLDATNREMRLGAISPARKISSGDEAPSDSIKRVALAGWLIIAIFFGGIGAWAATAPLNGAVVGNAVVKVDGNRKSVQHLDGGIVKELRVKEGDRVKAESRTAFSLAHFRADSPAGRRESTQPCVRRRDFVHEHLLKLE